MTEKEHRLEYWRKVYMDRLMKVHTKYIKVRNDYIAQGGILTQLAFKLSVTETNIFESVLRWIIENEQWNDIVKMFSLCPYYNSDWCLRAYLRCYDSIPKEQLYEITFSIYPETGFNFPVDIIEEMRKIRPEGLAEQLFGMGEGDNITVYRASLSSPDCMDKVRSEISWCTSPEIILNAYLFRTRTWGANCYLYRATISKQDVIAYISALGEVIQHGNVYDVQKMQIKELIDLCKEEDRERGCGHAEEHPIIDILYNRKA